MYGHTLPSFGDEPASVIGQIETSAAGMVVLRVGRRLHPQSSADYTWRQTEYVVLTPGEAEAMAFEMLEAIGFDTDGGLPRRTKVATAEVDFSEARAPSIGNSAESVA